MGPTGAPLVLEKASGGPSLDLLDLLDLSELPGDPSVKPWEDGKNPDATRDGGPGRDLVTRTPELLEGPSDDPARGPSGREVPREDPP